MVTSEEVPLFPECTFCNRLPKRNYFKHLLYVCIKEQVLRSTSEQFSVFLVTAALQKTHGHE